MATATAVVLAVAFALLGTACSDAEVAGERAPTFETTTLGGEPVALADHRGRPVLVNFFASWCGPCREELPLLDEAQRDGRAEVLAVVFRDSDRRAREFLEELGVSFPGLRDDGQIADAYGVGLRPGLPVTVAITPDGRIAGRHVGQLRRTDLDSLLATIEAATVREP